MGAPSVHSTTDTRIDAVFPLEADTVPLLRAVILPDLSTGTRGESLL